MIFNCSPFAFLFIYHFHRTNICVCTLIFAILFFQKGEEGEVIHRVHHTPEFEKKDSKILVFWTRNGGSLGIV